MDSDSSSLVITLSPELNAKTRRKLCALGHALQPVVLVGQRGVSQNLLDNVEAALLAHELIKIKVHDGDIIEEVAAQIHTASQAQLAQRIGKTLLFYRPHPEHPTLKL